MKRKDYHQRRASSIAFWCVAADPREILVTPPLCNMLTHAEIAPQVQLQLELELELQSQPQLQLELEPPSQQQKQQQQQQQQWAIVLRFGKKRRMDRAAFLRLLQATRLDVEVYGHTAYDGVLLHSRTQHEGQLFREVAKAVRCHSERWAWALKKNSAMPVPQPSSMTHMAVVEAEALPEEGPLQHTTAEAAAQQPEQQKRKRRQRTKFKRFIVTFRCETTTEGETSRSHYFFGTDEFTAAIIGQDQEDGGGGVAVEVVVCFLCAETAVTAPATVTSLVTLQQPCAVAELQAWVERAFRYYSQPPSLRLMDIIVAGSMPDKTMQQRLQAIRRQHHVVFWVNGVGSIDLQPQLHGGVNPAKMCAHSLVMVVKTKQQLSSSKEFCDMLPPSLLKRVSKMEIMHWPGQRVAVILHAPKAMGLRQFACGLVPLVQQQLLSFFLASGSTADCPCGLFLRGHPQYAAVAYMMRQARLHAAASTVAVVQMHHHHHAAETSLSHSCP